MKLQLTHFASDFTPLTPDADEARELARAELSRLKYQRDETILMRFLKWIRELLEDIFSTQSGDFTLSEILTLATVGILLLVLIFFAVRFGIRLRNQNPSQHHRAQRRSLFLDDDLVATELFTTAENALAQNDWNTAFVERFRGVIKALDEEQMITLRPGLTAREATELAVQAVGARELFLPAAQWFNEIFYGSGQADESALELSAQLQDHLLHNAIGASKKQKDTSGKQKVGVSGEPVTAVAQQTPTVKNPSNGAR